MKLTIDLQFAELLIAISLELVIQRVIRILNAMGDNMDIVGCADDFASQRAPMLFPSLYRKIVKLHQRRLFDEIKQHSDTKIWVYTSGSVYDLISNFMEMELEILNSVHVTATVMGDTCKLKREFGKDIAFRGVVDTQRELTFGSTEKARDEARHVGGCAGTREA